MFVILIHFVVSNYLVIIPACSTYCSSLKVSAGYVRDGASDDFK